jgi:NTP pyrophosphatase (non-canonical NTP hydrolase)
MAIRSAMNDLSLDELRRTNETRRVEWATRDGSRPWCGADWSNEMCGEAGEAANVVKKLRRLETGYKSPFTEDELLVRLGEELADVIICVDLLAMYYGIELGLITKLKFNETSDKQSLTTKFEVS